MGPSVKKAFRKKQLPKFCTSKVTFVASGELAEKTMKCRKTNTISESFSPSPTSEHPLFASFLDFIARCVRANVISDKPIVV
ncbi:hypothetical protein PHSY_000642 [Pseudozyma hubeiensis SY62]|uniref:Uncharacterized protein n=1 Tax=Pseudozyma hubeiensis (strain SY62) TaxID=1305764 RepID=R9NX08_PSEHS|nr:hypothetical protein PHSY_000642 [Pseudozyma hubeiensis SY62]GAC93081.1 hypothetical protein PHSY_000642 [Pseudozyma hubeiensis SY62]